MKFFLHNVRGFSDTEISFGQVNFLVGENSTGKTSFLGLLRLISSHNFWLQGDFYAKDVAFGTFNDLLSKNSELPFFQIGVTVLPEDVMLPSAKTDSGFSAMCMFGEYDGMPRVIAYTFFEDQSITHVSLYGENRGFITKAVSPKSQLFKGLNKMAQWQREAVKKKLTPFPKELPQALQGKIPIYFIVDLVKSKGKSISSETSSVIRLLSSVNESVWHSPIRIKPQRTYDEPTLEYSSEGIHTPYLIKKHLAKKKGNFRKYLEDFGNKGHLFNSISVKSYGEDSISPFELDLHFGDLTLALNQVGYGVSQILPVVTELLARRGEEFYLIQQPEIHLHPRAQSALGEFFFAMANTYGQRLFIETHSDFIIDRFRLSLSKTPENNVRAQILFFQKKGNHNVVDQIGIQPNGSYQQEQPKGFHNFFIHEELELLGIK